MQNCMENNLLPFLKFYDNFITRAGMSGSIFYAILLQSFICFADLL